MVEIYENTQGTALASRQFIAFMVFPDQAHLNHFDHTVIKSALSDRHWKCSDHVKSSSIRTYSNSVALLIYSHWILFAI